MVIINLKGIAWSLSAIAVASLYINYLTEKKRQDIINNHA